MALEIQKGRSKWWYGRVVVNGKTVVKNLGVLIAGSPPPTLREYGDAFFERSRAKAQAALDKFQLDLKTKGSAEELVQTLHQIRTGRRIKAVALADMLPRWKALPRRRPLSDRYLAQAESSINKFVVFLRARHSVALEMADVQASMCVEYLKDLEARGVSAKTYNNTLVFLRSLFHALRRDAGLSENPFEGIPTRDGETVFRRPFNAEELAAIVGHAEADAFIYPLIVIGICTAMRRGDCCTLLRSSVDLEGGFVTVKTSKTGEYIQIPIFPLLRAVLEKALTVETTPSSKYLFPKLEAHYRINPDHLTDRVRRVMRTAGFFDADEDDQTAEKPRGEIHQVMPHRLRKASIRDFHSFRVTWVTLALSAGVPLEIVQKVTGHRTASIVMKHYFQPGREEFRKTLSDKLPALIGGGESSVPRGNDELRKDLESMNTENWRSVRDKLLARLPKNKEPKLVGSA